MSDDESLSALRGLDEGTEWCLPRDMCTDKDDDDGMVGVSSEPDSLDGEETIENILDCLSGMNEKGDIEDIIVIVNTPDDSMLLFTDLTRNDIIIGRLQIAMMNWFNMEIGGGEEE